MSCPLSTSSPLGSLRNVFVENALERVVLVGVVDEAVLPAAPDDGCPGAAEDADGMGVVFSSGSGTVVEVGGPGVGVSGAVGEVADGVAQLAVGGPAEGDGPDLAGLTGPRGDAEDGTSRGGGRMW